MISVPSERMISAALCIFLLPVALFGGRFRTPAKSFSLTELAAGVCVWDVGNTWCDSQNDDSRAC